MEDLKQKLIEGLLHGDEDHKKWLTEAITAIFDDKNPPEPYGSGNKEKEIVRLEKELSKAIKRPKKGTELSYQGRIATLQGDISELRKQLKQAVKQHGIFKAIVEELEAHVTPLEPLDSTVPKRKSKGKIEEHFVMHLSDEHADEIVLPHQVGGLESFDFNIALCRAEEYVDTILKWKNYSLSQHTFPVLHILSYGDHTSGEIHDAKERSQFRNQFRNSLAIGQMQSLMIRDLAPHFKTVKVYCVPGNHGRRSVKKDFHGAWNNWDYLISEIARMHCQDHDNVEFAIPDCYSINIDINGHGFAIEHGDGVKSWMGIPWYGLERKTRRLVSLHNTFDKKIRYFVFGHFHALSTNADLKGEMIINGAWPATNPYSYEEFSGYREPMQLIHGVHENKGMSWRLPVYLKNLEREKEGPKRYNVVLASSDMSEGFKAGLDNSFPGGGAKL